jgi:CDP-paratose 2-epimerase
MVESLTGEEQIYTYVDRNRAGDHICYYSDLRKMKRHYPDWTINKTLKETVGEIVSAWKDRIRH